MESKRPALRRRSSLLMLLSIPAWLRPRPAAAHAADAVSANAAGNVADAAADSAAGIATALLPVLCWHDVVDERPADGTTIRRDDLVDQFELIRALGYTPISLQHWLDAREGRARLPARPVLLTFDDGHASFERIVHPLLQLYGYPAVVSVVSGWMTTPQTAPAGSSLLDWSRLRAIQAGGLVEVASHAHDLHRGVPANRQGNLQPAATTAMLGRASAPLPARESEAALQRRLIEDLQQSAELIETHTGRRPRALAWPFGAYDGAALAAARAAGFDVTLSLDPGSNRPVDDPMVMARTLVEASMGRADLIAALRAPARTDAPGRALADAIGTIRALHLQLDGLAPPCDPRCAGAAALADDQAWLSPLLDRVRRLGVNLVMLDALTAPDPGHGSDGDGDGDGDSDGDSDGSVAAWFDTDGLPVRGDWLNRVSWQLRTRAEVKVVIRLPLARLLVAARRHALGNRRSDARLASDHAAMDAAAVDSAADAVIRARVLAVVGTLLRQVPMAGLAIDADSPRATATGPSTGAPGDSHALAGLVADIRALARERQPGLMQVRVRREPQPDTPRGPRWDLTIGLFDDMQRLQRATRSLQQAGAGRPGAEPVVVMLAMADGPALSERLDELGRRGIRHIGLQLHARAGASGSAVLPDPALVERLRPRLSTATGFTPRD